MRVTIDRVGRVVIPKSLRDATGIGPDAELEMVQDGNAIRVEVVRHHWRAVEVVDGLPRLKRLGAVQLTDTDVRELRDRDQR
ncbi:MAG TPA: AbrB/MazE/SpoVT family DNA-binding domain-containing protein [Ilumatobacteraceae bacterium]|nr:AbrB/MazE/SpoVT family DNA-binding domain-containing protein [Ilumatobacteraceae bacterium]